MLALSLFVVATPLPPRLRAPPAITDEDLPTVDVFIPTYNEDAELLATTLAAAKAMDYPADKLTVWLLDDGGTDQKCNADKLARGAAPRERRHATLQELVRATRRAAT